MNRMLRGHHLLCVHGFRGMGYSPAFIHRMGEIVSEVRNHRKDFMIKVVVNLDEACACCPHKGETICEMNADSDLHVTTMDRNVLQHLGLKEGKLYSKQFLVEQTAKRVDPEDLDHLCQGCSWLGYGVCKEGIDQLREKLGIMDT
jgi:uncharacterized protein